MMWPLMGILLLVVGFVLRLNAMLVVAVAGLATALLGGISLHDAIAKLGDGFVDNRSVLSVLIALPVIGLLERNGLRERAQSLIKRIDAATSGRILMCYLLIRQISAAFGLTALGGQAQMVRPLIAPMAEGGAQNEAGPITEDVGRTIRAHAAAVDNIGAFFGEDIFVAVGSILLMKSILDQAGIVIPPLSYAVWAIPTAVAAFIIHAIRLWLFDRHLMSQARQDMNAKHIGGAA